MHYLHQNTVFILVFTSNEPAYSRATGHLEIPHNGFKMVHFFLMKNNNKAIINCCVYFQSFLEGEFKNKRDISLVAYV